MPSDLEAKSTETNEQQEARAKLRESFLRAVSELHGKFLMIFNTFLVQSK